MVDKSLASAVWSFAQEREYLPHFLVPASAENLAEFEDMQIKEDEGLAVRIRIISLERRRLVSSKQGRKRFRFPIPNRVSIVPSN